MKKSELLYIQADESTNDADFQYFTEQAKRAENLERFCDYFLPKIKSSKNVLLVSERPTMFIIEFSDGLKTDYYPKSDRLYIKKMHHWKSDGLSWIISKL